MDGSISPDFVFDKDFVDIQPSFIF